MSFVICGRMIFSSVFDMSDSSAMGLYYVPIDLSLLGLEIGDIFAVFQAEGIVLCSVLCCICLLSILKARGPRCLMFILSGPVKLLFCDCFITFVVPCILIPLCGIL